MQPRKPCPLWCGSCKGSIPVIGVGGWRTPSMMETHLGTTCDAFAISRPILEDPGIVNKWVENPEHLTGCVSCNKCQQKIEGMNRSAAILTSWGILSWWNTATEFDSEKAWNRSLVWMGFHPGKAKVYRDRSPKTWGFSIRCVKWKCRNWLTEGFSANFSLALCLLPNCMPGNINLFL
jgi:tRNA-dihydrouridine synthase